MLEIILFLLLGILFGIIMGLIPGIHPNMIILAVPFLVSLNIHFVDLLVFIVAMGVTNSIVDFIPSILLGAPEGGNELSVLPGHKMLMDGHGYDAVKLAVIGAIGSAFVFLLALPVLVFSLSSLYIFIKPFIYLLLLFIVLLMMLTENGKNKIVAVFVFVFSGALGMVMGKIPVDETLILFPVFSGFFGISLLLIQLKQKTRLPKQKESKDFVSRKTINRSVISGTLGGVVSGFLPGVGSSEIATLATVDKNDKSFLITLGALTTANTILSIMALWLIGRSRSGLAVAVSQIGEIGFSEIILIIGVFTVSVGLASIVTLKLTKIFLEFAQKIDYSLIGKFVIIFIMVMTFIFTGIIGIIILATCTAMGVFVNLVGIKRGNLMGVLILPTILFYAGF